MHFLLLIRFYSSTKIRFLFAILIYFRSLLSMLRHFLRSNDCYLPSCLLPFFHLILTSNFLPMHFLLLIHFYSSTKHHHSLPNHFEHVECVEHVVYIVHLIYWFHMLFHHHLYLDVLNNRLPLLEYLRILGSTLLYNYGM